MVSSRASSSTLPEARLALAVPAGRARTRPRTWITNSLRSRSASENWAWLSGIEHDLQQALAVAQVDENHAAMIAAAMHPAGNRDLLTDQLFVDLAAIVRTHGKPDRPGWGGDVTGLLSRSECLS